MAKVKKIVKIQLPSGKATPAPPVGPVLAQHQVNISEFCQKFNAATKDGNGLIVPVEITVYEDKTYTFIVKQPPAAVLLKKAAGIEKGSGTPNKTKVAKITKAQLRQIAEQKLPDLNANDVEAAMKTIAGTAKNMGIEITD